MSSLYLTYFGLAAPPFSITPDPRFFFEGKEHGVFIAGLLHASLQAEGIVVVLGEVGSGKTLMSRILLSRLSEHVDTVYLPNPAFARDEIIEVIARDLGVEGTAPGQGLRLEALQQELIKRHEQGRQFVVLIDEAHAMPMDSIEEIRRLSNLETDNCKLVHVVLCGQPELETLLEAPHLRQVRDRVVYRLYLRSLSREDSRAYLDHRLRVAGWRGGRMFSWFAEWLLLNDAKGRARRINILADKALLAAYADNKKQVLVKHVRLAIRDAGANFANSGKVRNWQWKLITAWAASIVMAVLFALWFSTFLHQKSGGSPSPAPVSNPASPQPPKAAPPLPSSPKKSGAVSSPVPAAQPNISSMASAPVLQNQVKALESSEPSESQGEDIDTRVKQSYSYAQQQSAMGHYAIRVATLPYGDRVLAYIDSTEEMISPERVYVRPHFFSNQQKDSPPASYVAYFGSYPTYEAAMMAISGLPIKLRKEKPTIRTWKEIFNAPWSL